jgi:hypothetical protein
VTVKRLRRTRARRVVARVMCTLLLTPQLMAWSQRPAAAQQRRDRTIIVIDFGNRSAIPSPLLGRRAAAAMALQLRQSDDWDPVPQSAVEQKIAELRLRPPYDRVQLQTLARALDAGAVLTGDVLSARVTQNPAQATVRMVVRLLDVASGELVNGAVATGTASHIGLDTAEDVILDEALSRAAFDARQRMERYQLPEGTVLNTTVVGETRQDALLNIGARHGVKKGTEFVVLRGGELVGYLSASVVDPDKTVAAITQNFRGVKPEDIVRAIFKLPEGADIADTGPIRARDTRPGDVVVPDETTQTKRSRKGMTGAARVAAGLLLALGLYALASRSSSGGTSAFETAARATTVPAADPTQAAAVRVTWSRPRQIPANAVIQYQVYRVDPTSGNPILIGIAPEGDKVVFDTVAEKMIVNYYDIASFPDAGALVTAALTVPGIVPGRQYSYIVRTIYNVGVTFEEDTGNGGTGGTGGTGTTTPSVRISTPSRASGRVTPIVPPSTTSPADQATGVDLTNVTFTWTTVAGADRYSVQVSADPLNPNSFQEVAQYINPSRTGGQSVTRTVNIANRFAGRTLLAWRVGARNSGDAAAPVGGYVFSDVKSFSPQ